MKKITLVQMKPKQKGRISEIIAGKILLSRLMSMGIYPGKEVTKISNFIFKGPIAIRVSRSVVALGYGTASKILVEVE